MSRWCLVAMCMWLPLAAQAQDAFTRALSLNPDLSLAHNLYTLFEIESGRVKQAMLRLLERVRQRTSDPELFAGNERLYYGRWTYKYESAAVHGAAFRWSDTVLAYLVEQGAELTVKDKVGRDAYTWAAGVTIPSTPPEPSPRTMATIQKLLAQGKSAAH